MGGNVLTSQRVTDIVLKAFGAAAASQGCMNNFTFGDEGFGYYETIAGALGELHCLGGVLSVRCFLVDTLTHPDGSVSFTLSHTHK